MKRFARKEQMKRHEFQHKDPSEYPHECDICKKKFIEITRLKYHTRKHHGGEETPTTPHVRWNRLLKNFPCDSCSKSFKSKTHLERHELTHKDRSIWPYHCAICDKAFIEISRYKQHQENIHRMTWDIPQAKSGPSVLQCSVCEKQFHNAEHWKRHERTHKDPRDFLFLCEYCGKWFKKVNSQQHLMIHSKIKRYPCTYCHASFNTEGLLDRHLPSHTGVLPYMCQFCGEGFARKFQLLRHQQQAHTDFLPLQCSACDKGFTEPEDLDEHEKSHLTAELFSCDICPKGFRTKVQLKAHEWRHRPKKEWPFECLVCGKKFTRRASKIMHQKDHGIYEYQCEVCQKGFDLRSKLNEHIVTHE